MKMERIGDNRLKITATGEDLLLHGLSFDSFSPDAPNVQDFFWNLLRRAEYEMDFTVEDGKVYIEAMPYKDNGLVIFLTKPGALPADGRLRRVRHRVKAPASSSKNEVTTLYRFDSFDDLCALCHTWRYMGERSSLYALDDAYILSISFERNDYDVKYAHAKLIEFARPASSLSVAYLEEHAKKICDGDAIPSVLRYF